MKGFFDFDYTRLYDMAGIEIDLYYNHHNINDYMKSRIFEDYKDCRQKLLDSRINLSRITSELEAIEVDPILYFKEKAKEIYDRSYSNLKSVKVTIKKVESIIEDLDQRIPKQENEIIKKEYEGTKQFFENRHIYYSDMHYCYKRGMRLTKELINDTEKNMHKYKDDYINKLLEEKQFYLNEIQYFEAKVEEYRKCVLDIDNIIK